MRLFLVVLCGSWSVLVLGNAFDTRLTPAEEAALQRRLDRFYRSPVDPAAMGAIPGKHSIRRNAPATRSRRAEDKRAARRSAAYCKFLERHFPGLDCGPTPLTWASTEKDDRLADIASSWFEPEQLSYGMDDLPLEGKLSGTFWSGDYWRTRWGLTSYRYSNPVDYKEYEEAIKAYEQPKQWTGLLEEVKGDLAKAALRLVAWSPSEKYDLTVGDATFALTIEQKSEGADLLDPKGKVPDWFGLCHGWAPASIFSPPPTKPVTAKGPGGVEVKWLPHDVQAMASLAWSNGDYWSSFAGGRCYEEKPGTHPNGRLKQQECFDVNPATLHLTLANFLGKHGQPFLMDSTFDHEVWNHPIVSYRFEYFNPLDTTRKSAKWQDVAIAYDDKFKEKDRFQKPLTRGKRKRSGYDDAHIQRVVGVIATVVYGDEMDAVHELEPKTTQETTRVVYTYDLELAERRGQWVATGGEWHENAHPDFLWIPQKDSYPWLSHDGKPVPFALDKAPDPALTALATKASARDAYPLCGVLKTLADASSGATAANAYRCR